MVFVRSYYGADVFENRKQTYKITFFDTKEEQLSFLLLEKSGNVKFDYGFNKPLGQYFVREFFQLEGVNQPALF